MNKIKKCLWILLTILVTTAAGCAPQTSEQTTSSLSETTAGAAPENSRNTNLSSESDETTIENRRAGTTNKFSLDVTLDVTAHKLTVNQNLTYHNNTGMDLENIYFNLIPQAFRENGGGINIIEISVNSQACSLEQVDGTVYSLSLPASLPAGKQIDIRMNYEVYIPNIQNRFGYQENVFNLGNFIITPAVYGQNGWTIEPYVDIGDAFYTDIADYNVTINVPEDYIVAATGRKIGSNSYHAENVRDFAFCASNSFQTLSDTWKNTAITVYYGDNMTATAERALDTARKSLELFSNKFGTYPYSDLNIVMSGLTGGVNGMEYPQLIMISPQISLESMEDMGVDISDQKETEPYMVDFDNSVCHEIAHQWFYGIVGNDQITFPWLDEGFCRYCEYLYQKKYPPMVSEDDGIYLMEDRLNDFYIRVSGKGGEAGTGYAPDTTDLKLTLYDWEQQDPMGYSEIYDKGASLIYKIEQEIGEGAFDRAVKEYVQRFAYGFVTAEDFKAFWNEKGDLSELLTMYLG